MKNYAYLGFLGLISVAASIFFKYLGKKKWVIELPYMAKQIIIGITFGLISIISTEYGVTINGAVMNARDAAPLCAALLFGAPSGIIAGLIGGIERWFAVYWGVGSFTRLACTLGTILAGIFGAVLRKFVFDDEAPSTVYGLATGMVAEVMHMMLVIITNMNESKRAFEVLRTCTVPMVTVNAISVALAVFITNALFNKKEKKKNLSNTKLSELFQKGMLFVICIAFIVSIVFTGVLQNKISNSDSDELLRLNLEDVCNQISVASDNNMLQVAKNIAVSIDNLTVEINEKQLSQLANHYGVSEINYIDQSGIIVVSTNELFNNFNMYSGPQSENFMKDLIEKGQCVEKYGPISYDQTISRKYSGCKLANGCFVQVGYDASAIQKDIAIQISDSVTNRHVGETGTIVVIDSNWNIVSASDPSIVGVNLVDQGIDFSKDFTEQYVKYTTVFNEQKMLFMFVENEGYIILASLPSEEAEFNAIETVYLITFMEILVFAGLFVLIYFLVRKLVVMNIIKIDNSLAQITQGNLYTKVDVNESREFVSLSNGINETVDRLKDYIKEANERIDAELKYAADIQRSALPTVFPAFPSLMDVFDLYASMDPAKEVGGDFYDFFIIRKHYLAFVVADVSGKGIPASLFMMRAKTLIKTYAEGDLSVEDIFTNANFNLCEGNDAGLFVTAWMGILNLKTGECKFANAGHNPPVIKRKDGTFEYLHSKPGFVLGGMEGIVYAQMETTLMPGDQIFIYTDGVTEATNLNKELFGEDRLINSLNKAQDLSAEEICASVKADIDEFVGEADQFDDITMMSLKIQDFYK